MTLSAVALAVSFLAPAGCKSADHVPDSPAAEVEEKQDPGTYLDVDIEIPAGGEAASVSVPGISDRGCVGRLVTGEPEVVELEEWKVTSRGYHLVFERAGGGREPLVLGVISDIKEDTGENIFNLGRYLEWWRSEGVEAIVLAGDGGDTTEGLIRVLDVLAADGWPVLVINGNRESKDVYLEAIEQSRLKNPNVFNLGQQRVVDLPGARLVALPGYHDPRFLHSVTACRYFQFDVAGLVPEARSAEVPVVLVAHSGPRGAGSQAIDYARGAGNVGDANINRLIVAGGIPFGIFGHIHEAGGKATDLLGDEVVPQGELVSSFFLNVGPADSLPWSMNDGTESRGMAGIVSFEGSRASYEIRRLRQLTPEQSALARELEPEG